MPPFNDGQVRSTSGSIDLNFHRRRRLHDLGVISSKKPKLSEVDARKALTFVATEPLLGVDEAKLVALWEAAHLTSSDVDKVFQKTPPATVKSLLAKMVALTHNTRTLLGKSLAIAGESWERTAGENRQELREQIDATAGTCLAVLQNAVEKLDELRG